MNNATFKTLCLSILIASPAAFGMIKPVITIHKLGAEQARELVEWQRQINAFDHNCFYGSFPIPDRSIGEATRHSSFSVGDIMRAFKEDELCGHRRSIAAFLGIFHARTGAQSPARLLPKKFVVGMSQLLLNHSDF